MNYEQDIRNSKLGATLKGISTRLATEWIHCVKRAYDTPNIDLIELDESVVEKDLVENLSRAIDSLKNETSCAKKSRPGYSFGYLCGYVQGALNVQWSDRYLIEPSQEFADLLKLRSMLELIEVDNIVLKKAQIIYEYYLNRREQPMKLEAGLPKNVVSIARTGKSQSADTARCKEEFTRYFKHLFTTNYRSLLRSYKSRCVPDLTDYLDENAIIDIVGSEHFANVG